MRLLLTLLLLLSVTPISHAGPPLIGMNLAGIDYYSQEYMLTDVADNLSPLFAQKNGAAWGENDPGSLTLGTDGYPTFIASNHSARTIWDLPKGHAGGQYALLWEGTGNITPLFFSGSSIISTAPGRVVLDLPVSSGSSNRRGFDIQSTDASDPVRNIRIVPIGQEAAYTGGEPSNPYRSVFTDRWTSMGAFRYMDPTKTNDSTISDWADRPKPDDFTQTDRGIALEHLITHANVTQGNPWFTIPHAATDDYIEQMAIMVRDNLDAGLAARIELSNEVWNSQFSQQAYSVSQAHTIGQPGNSLGGLRWYSHRTVEMFDIFEEVFTNNGANPEGMDRLVRVMAAQSANDWVAEQVLEYGNAYLKTDALAIAPYFGVVPSEGAEADSWTGATWPQRITKVEQVIRSTKRAMRDHVALLRNKRDSSGNFIYSDIKLFSYEGGQHFVGASNTHDDPALTQLMQDLSGRPEMRQWYFDYLSYWDKIGGEDFMLYNSLGERSKWGSWGHLEYEGQPLSESPKMQGILDYLGSVQGDYDLSGTIDMADYEYWKLKFKTNDIQADGNNDGVVDAADYTIWRNGFEAAQASASTSSLPEPGTGALLMSILPWLFGRRRRARAVEAAFR